MDRPGVARARRRRGRPGGPDRGRPGRLPDEPAAGGLTVTYEPVYTRTPRNAFIPSPVFVGIVAVFVVSAVMTWSHFGNVKVDVFLFIVTGWLVSLCLHEYAHALAGFFAGDKTVADRGYLRLNPL